MNETQLFFYFLYFTLLYFTLLYLYLKNKLRAKKIRLSRGVAVRALVEICIDDISAVLRATYSRFQLTFPIWAGLMHLLLRIFKFGNL
jgi:hypothetical protein